MKQITAWLHMALGCLWMLSCNAQQENTIKKIDKVTVKAEVIGKNVQLIDVRTPQEYANGHIEGAVNINVKSPSFKEEIKSLDKNEPVFLYCKMGGRSSMAAQILKKEGFTEIYNYKGGYDDWKSTE